MWHDAFLTRVRGDARVNKPTATSVVQKHSADDCAPCTSLAHDDKDAAAGSRVRRAALSWLSPRACRVRSRPLPDSRARGAGGSLSFAWSPPHLVGASFPPVLDLISCGCARSRPRPSHPLPAQSPARPEHVPVLRASLT